jgi:bifunctional DNA-binding transcriptional regulator/antitoxin component of YhaV-PrlF toxin-antitoxin module
MKLQSQVSRQVERKKYHKFWVVIPNEIVERLGWEGGQELEHEVKGQTLIMRLVPKDRLT